MLFEFSCHGYQKRSTGCHGSCETYKKEKTLYDEQKATFDKQKAINDGVYRQRSKSVERAIKSRKGWR